MYICLIYDIKNSLSQVIASDLNYVKYIFGSRFQTLQNVQMKHLKFTKV